MSTYRHPMDDYDGFKPPRALTELEQELLEALKAALPYAESRAEDLTEDEVLAREGRRDELAIEASKKAWAAVLSGRAAIAKAEGFEK